MNELILVLEENPEIQSVISSSLKDSPIFINQELYPDYFLQQVQNLKPDLIFISNNGVPVTWPTSYGNTYFLIQAETGQPGFSPID